MAAPALVAGLRYGVEAFALGFALALVRIPLLVPAIGELAAVLCELPVMLVAMGFRARTLAVRHDLQSGSALASMGGTGFAVLMMGELTLAMLVGGGVSQWLAGLAMPPGAIGLAGQIVFAGLPLLVRRQRRRS
ncbi:hypothetical protein [Blastomonas sp.]|uniref:hypothetical protein n=1 Tax=Blastomonas sp. TaxID=1909299 RepID=UPI00391AB798